MKKQTAEKLLELNTAERLKFDFTDAGIELSHDLSDEELKELVELEYGQTQQSVLELFKCIIKEVVKTSIDYAKKELETVPVVDGK